MNIFLLFISMFIMIGYYIISSPSQKLEEQEPEYVIQQSDARSIVDCVISKQNSVMVYPAHTLDKPCVDRYGITSKYYVFGENNTSLADGDPNDGAGEWYDSTLTGTQSFYIITTTGEPLTDDQRGSTLEVIGKYYSSMGTLGIYDGTSIVTPGANLDVPNAVKNDSDLGLTNGDIVYFMQYNIPDYADPIPDEEHPEKKICPPGFTPTLHFGVWKCDPTTVQRYCQDGADWNLDTGECVPNANFHCSGCPDNDNICNYKQLVKIDDTWVCLDPPENIIENPCDGVKVLNANTLKWECTPLDSDDANTCETKLASYVWSTYHAYGDDNQPLPYGLTMTIRTISCGRCEKPFLKIEPDSDNPDVNTCELYCVPDTSKIDTQTCFTGNPACCTGNQHGIYFGFTSDSKIEDLNLKNSSGTTIDNVNGTLGDDGSFLEDTGILDDQHKQNKKFNCMECTGYATINSDTSISKYTAFCNPTSDAQTVRATGEPKSPDDLSGCNYVVDESPAMASPDYSAPDMAMSPPPDENQPQAVDPKPEKEPEEKEPEEKKPEEKKEGIVLKPAPKFSERKP